MYSRAFSRDLFLIFISSVLPIIFHFSLMNKEVLATVVEPEMGGGQMGLSLIYDSLSYLWQDFEKQIS